MASFFLFISSTTFSADIVNSIKVDPKNTYTEFHGAKVIDMSEFRSVNLQFQSLGTWHLFKNA